MYHTIQLSSCVSVQGTFVASLANGEIVINDGSRTWRGRPVAACAALVSSLGPIANVPEQRA